MKLIPIFVSNDSEDGLWSIQLAGESQSELEKFFDMINDVAASQTLDEAEEMENLLYDYSEQAS